MSKLSSLSFIALAASTSLAAAACEAPVESPESAALEARVATQQALECKVALIKERYGKQLPHVLEEAIDGMNATHRKNVEAIVDLGRTKATVSYKGKSFLLVDNETFPIRVGEKGRSFAKRDVFDFTVGTLKTPLLDYSDKYQVEAALKPAIDKKKCLTLSDDYGAGRALAETCPVVMQNVFEDDRATTHRTRLAPLFGGGVDDFASISIRCIYKAGATAAERKYYATPIANDIEEVAPTATSPSAPAATP
jgi:hypothetical protein